MNKREYQICSKCVMDTTDSEIIFDQSGICNHCHEFAKEVSKRWFPSDDGLRKLNVKIDQIKKIGAKHDYDCILGLSGGLDSSYLALILKKYGLRPLVVHVDSGWNSEMAVYNIEKIVNYCNFELYTHVMDWEDMRDLQLAYLKAGISNQDVPQDHAFFATLYHFAVENNISVVLSGGNIATESVFPSSWHHSAMDAINLLDIHKTHGTGPLKSYKTISFFEYYFYYPFVKKMRTLRPLDFMHYDKKTALAELSKLGYKEYGRKHGESRFTKFFQNYYLPKKFGFDKRKPHFSSLIMSGQMTREQAMMELTKTLYEPSELEEDKNYVAKKLGIGVFELDALVSCEGSSYKAYKNWDTYHQIAKQAQRIVEKVFRRDLSNYS